MSFNLLIVDDSASMRAVVKKIVGLTGMDVRGCLEAENGRRALEVLNGEWVDAVILDINMPVMNGLELLERMSQDETLKRIPVVIMSTDASEEHRRAAFALGARDFIRKPFVPEEVRRTLYGVLGFDERGAYGAREGNPDGVDF